MRYFLPTLLLFLGMTLIPGHASAAEGTIYVRSNISNMNGASWTITGPAVYTDSNYVYYSSPLGTYTIVWGSVPGYGTPPPQTLSLVNDGDSFFFYGTYVPDRSANLVADPVVAPASANVGSPVALSSVVRNNGALSTVFDAMVSTVSYPLSTYLLRGLAFDGTNMWSVNQQTGDIVKISPAGVETIYPNTFGFTDTHSNAFNTDITFDGTNMWALYPYNGIVVKVSPTGVMTPYYIHTVPFGSIASDGTNAWVTFSGSMLGCFRIPGKSGCSSGGIFTPGPPTGVIKITPTGGVTEYPATGVNPMAIAFDGTNMWMTGTASGICSVTKVSPSGVMTTWECLYKSPFMVEAIAFDGTNMWTPAISGSGGASISKISPTGAMTTYAAISGPLLEHTIAFDGANIWGSGLYSYWNLVKFSPTGDSVVYPNIKKLYLGYDLASDGTNIWATSLNSIIKIIPNSGNFPTFFQVATEANGGGTITDLASSTMTALVAGASNTATATYTFATAGTYSVRACADKSDHNYDFPGAIIESNENDNCSAWTNITIPTPTCTLPWGGTLANGSSTTAYQTPSVTYPATCASDPSETRTCTNGTLSGSYTNQTCTVDCANGGCDLAGNCKNGANNPPACSTCGTGLVWNSGTSSCVPPTSATITVSASPSRVHSGDSSHISWTASDPSVASCSLTKNGAAWGTTVTSAGKTDASIITQSVYTVTSCEDIGGNSVVIENATPASVIVNVVPKFGNF